MVSNKNIPVGVTQSFVKSDPLGNQEVSGVSIEWIETTSPYRKYIAAYCYGTESFVQRDEIRFRRTRNGVEPDVLWSGKVPVARTYACKLIDRYLNFCLEFPAGRMPPEGSMDGEWYVIKSCKDGQRHVCHIYSPDFSKNKTLQEVQVEMELLLAQPQSYFEDTLPSPPETLI